MSEYRTYWLINDEKFTTFKDMQRKVLAGAIAIEVSADVQQVAAEERNRRAKANAIRDAELRKVADQRQHEQSVEGRRQIAVRTAAQHPGGIVTTSMNPLAELDAFGPAKTNLLR